MCEKYKRSLQKIVCFLSFIVLQPLLLPCATDLHPEVKAGYISDFQKIPIPQGICGFCIPN
jgi:hypothetical protein